MKTFTTGVVWLAAIFATIFGGASFGQSTNEIVEIGDYTVDLSTATPLATNDVPEFATFYYLQNYEQSEGNPAPVPIDIFFPWAPVYALGTNASSAVFLVDDTWPNPAFTNGPTITWPIYLTNLTLVAPEDVPEFGTFFLYQDQFASDPPNPPPYPFDLYPQCDVYSLGITNVFLIDDTGVSRLEPLGGPTPLSQNYGPTDLRLLITGVSDGLAFLILTNTQPGTNYEILAKRQLSDPSWTRVGIITGLANTNATPVYVPTPAYLPTAGNANSAFFWARQEIIPSGLWLELPTNSMSVANQLRVILHNTIEDQQYDLLTNSSLAGEWTLAQSVFGSSGDSTTVNLPTGGQASLFVKGRFGGSSDGSGLPDWWQLLYFGHLGIDPYAMDSSGDGWNYMQDYVSGFVPGSFNTPAPPQGVTLRYNSSSGAVNVSWVSSSGSVTGYTVEKHDAQTGTTQDFVITNGITSFADTISDDFPFSGGAGPAILASYKINAIYSGGTSAWSDPANIQFNYAPVNAYNTELPIQLVGGAQGVAYVAANALPPGTVAIRISRIDSGAMLFGDSSFNASYDIPVSSLTNGIVALPSTLSTASSDSYGNNSYALWAQTVDANNTPSAPAFLGFTYSLGDTFNCAVAPYFDGRIQLKQNLNFLLRAATIDSPFQFTEFDSGITLPFFSNPTNYAYAGLYDIDNEVTPPELDLIGLNVLQPFQNNHLLRNFVFNVSDMDPNTGLLTTGAGDLGGGLILQFTPTYLFQPPTSPGGSNLDLLSESQSQWIRMSPTPEEVGVTTAGTNYIMGADVLNIFGLQFISSKLAFGTGAGLGVNNLSAGGSSPHEGYVYSETAQPELQLTNYDFWQPYVDWLPGHTEFSTAKTNHLLIASVGNTIQIAGYAKYALQNGSASVFGYCEQYFDQAFVINTNGAVTTNQAGFLSPYGMFFPTNPGPAALVTLPDIDPPYQRGTGVVYCVKLQFDVNHDGVMDESFGGPDNTSQANRYTFWINNNFDRWHDVDCFLGSCDQEQDDLAVKDVAKLPFGDQVIDGQYVYEFVPAIPSTRDLQDYARLWIPGLSSLMAALPTNYTVQLVTSGGQLKIFKATEPAGGTNYLFDETTALNQVSNAPSLYVGVLSANFPVVLSGRPNIGEHFIFCGVQPGDADLALEIIDGDQNVVATTAAYLHFSDIKDMYERWTLGERPDYPPTNVAQRVVENLPQGETVPFAYPTGTDTNTPYILYVHGWNMESWEKDRYGESAYKRLYWQGYQGKFGVFHWPTDNRFGGAGSIAFDPHNYDNSEFNAWKSALGLCNKLIDLNSQYPGHVYLIAHSMGNVVSGEALRLAGNVQIVNTYVAMQGAVPAYSYDQTVTSRDLGIFDSDTPNAYANYWTNGAPCYFASSAGAGSYVNFYNTHDYALNLWITDQNLKPDFGYQYHPVSGIYTHGSGTLDFPGDTYELFSYVIEARCYALGAQPFVGGVFKVGSTYQQVELDAPPFSYGAQHKYHSAEFRSDNMQRANFWNQLLLKTSLKE